MRTSVSNQFLDVYKQLGKTNAGLNPMRNISPTSFLFRHQVHTCIPFLYAHGHRAHAKLPMTATATSLELGSKDHMRDSTIARNLIITTAIVDHVCKSSATCAI